MDRGYGASYAGGAAEAEVIPRMTAAICSPGTFSRTSRATVSSCSKLSPAVSAGIEGDGLVVSGGTAGGDRDTGFGSALSSSLCCAGVSNTGGLGIKGDPAVPLGTVGNVSSGIGLLGGSRPAVGEYPGSSGPGGKRAAKALSRLFLLKYRSTRNATIIMTNATTPQTTPITIAGWV